MFFPTQPYIVWIKKFKQIFSICQRFIYLLSFLTYNYKIGPLTSDIYKDGMSNHREKNIK